MNPHFKIEDKSIINEILDKVEYGTLALSVDNTPYAVPLNFVRIEDTIYFHGALKNRKMKMLSKNQRASFSVVENHSLIDSDFSSNDGLACPATQFFKSISIDGSVEIVEDKKEKIVMFEALMKKLQPKGGYSRPFSDEVYDKAFKATVVYKLVSDEISCKFKFGQHLNEERFEMVVRSLEARGTQMDITTVKIMREQRGVYDK
jgi:hypothetical protein